jgi:hypothetical protein
MTIQNSRRNPDSRLKLGLHKAYRLSDVGAVKRAIAYGSKKPRQEEAIGLMIGSATPISDEPKCARKPWGFRQNARTLTIQ